MINKNKLNNLTNEIWKSAERLRGKFKAYEYQSVILPMIVIRRLECVLEDARENLAHEKRKKTPDISEEALKDFVKRKMISRQSPLSFSNSTDFTLFEISREDPTAMEANFRKYIKGFSDNIQEIIDKFDFHAVIGQLVSKDRLAPIVNQYAKEPLGLSNISNLEMGYVYEELLRKFSEQSGEEAGEHFTPREVIRLMVELLDIQVKDTRVSIYDPACGTGGMLSVAKEHILEKVKDDEKLHNTLDKLTTLYGQELQDQNYAICKSDMLIKGDLNSSITCGNSLIPDDETAKERGDQHTKFEFDYMLSNPPFGVTWGGKDGYAKKVDKLSSTRYKAGKPRSNDGAFLFLQTMIEKMKKPEKGGSKIAIVFNGSPLSNGDCGSGESEIRRWILENDYLDSIVMLPDQLFYNTGIFTYIWILSNKKEKKRAGKVLIIDGRKQYEKEPKSFGNKRKKMELEHREWIEKKYRDFKEDDYCKIFNREDFSYHKVAVTFWQTDENEQPAYQTTEFDKNLTSANFKKLQEYYKESLDLTISAKSLFKEEKFDLRLDPEDDFLKKYLGTLKELFKDEVQGMRAKEANDYLKMLGSEVFYRHPHYINDHEYIPYGEDIEKFLKKEIGKKIISFQDSPELGYEILPNKYFYKYKAPEKSEKLLEDFWKLEKYAENILTEMKKEIS